MSEEYQRIELITGTARHIESSVKRHIPLSEYGMSESVQVSESVHIGAMIAWSEMEFARFAFDLVALLRGTYEVGRLSSFYGVGSSWQEMVKEVTGGELSQK